MDLYEIIKDIPQWVPLVGSGLIIAGMATQAGIRIYKNTKRLNARFSELVNEYQDSFSKEELIPFYKEVATEIRPNLVGRKKSVATEMVERLESQIMAYAAQEVDEAIKKGAKLDFHNPIMPHSETYRKAIEIFHQH